MATTNTAGEFEPQTSSWPPSHWPGHQYQSVDQVPQTPPSPPQIKLATAPVIEPAPQVYDADASQLTWRPFYLRRSVLAAFTLVFVLILIAIEVLLAFSNKNHGIATGNSNQHYLWTYGPTAFLTLIAALWVEPSTRANSPLHGFV